MATRRKKNTEETAPARAVSNPSAPVRRARNASADKQLFTEPASAAGKAQAVLDVFAKAKGFKGVVRILGSTEVDEKVESLPTGSIGLDRALGIGGLARGRITEIFGPESGGKTTLALQVVANTQRAGGTAVYIDAEHALDESYCRKLGVDVDTLLLLQPDNGEQAFEAIELAVSSGVDIVVVDSVAALTPKAEIEGNYGDSTIGLQARLMSQGLRKLTGLLGKSRTCVVFINQIREKIGVMFGNPETTTGGRALKFYSSQRIDIRRVGPCEAGREFGNKCRAKVVKNKMAAPFKEAEFEIIFGKGINQNGELLHIAVEAGVITQSGAWYSYGDTRLGMGAANALVFLEEHPVLRLNLYHDVMELNSGDTSDGTAQTE